jgi:hypothetical protein
MGKITLHVAQSVNTLHKGDNKDDDDDDDDDNFNHRRRRNSVNTKAVYFYGKSLENLLHLLLTGMGHLHSSHLLFP